MCGGKRVSEPSQRRQEEDAVQLPAATASHEGARYCLAPQQWRLPLMCAATEWLRSNVGSPACEMGWHHCRRPTWMKQWSPRGSECCGPQEIPAGDGPLILRGCPAAGGLHRPALDLPTPPRPRILLLSFLRLPPVKLFPLLILFLLSLSSLLFSFFFSFSLFFSPLKLIK